MRSVLILEIAAWLIVPVVLGYLRKHRAISVHSIALVLATQFSVLTGTYSLYTSASLSPLGLPLKPWLWALGMTAVFWVLGYAVTRSLLKLVFHQ